MPFLSARGQARNALLPILTPLFRIVTFLRLLHWEKAKPAISAMLRRMRMASSFSQPVKAFLVLTPADGDIGQILATRECVAGDNRYRREVLRFLLSLHP
jgi:hypothetical protein